MPATNLATILRDEIARYVVVPESTSGVDTGIDLQPGDFLRVHGAQTMNVDPFGGVWGPEGTGVTSGWPFPLTSAPDFSLIGVLPSGLFPIGRDERLVAGQRQRLLRGRGPRIPLSRLRRGP